MSARLWPAGLVALLAVSAAANVLFVAVATRDPSFAVEPDYYRKALRWNETMAQEARNRALGWAVTVATEPAGQPGHLRLVARLTDSAGAPITAAAVEVEAFHGARAAERLTGTLISTGAGVYAADLPLRRPGLWELRFLVTRREDVFTQRLEADLPGTR